MDNQRQPNDALLLVCPSPEDLQPLASALAEVLKSGDILLLYGPLGAGKTTFTQALARALAVGENQYVSSPSFALMHEYHGRLPIAHMDLYRLADEDDVEAAGLLDYFGGETVCIVEWPERLGELTPKCRLDITLEPIDHSLRQISLCPHGEDWHSRVARLRERLARSTGAENTRKPRTDS